MQNVCVSRRYLEPSAEGLENYVLGKPGFNVILEKLNLPFLMYTSVAEPSRSHVVGLVGLATYPPQKTQFSVDNPIPPSPK